MKTFKIRGITFDVPVLTLGQLTAADKAGVIDAINEDTSSPAFKPFCKALLPTTVFNDLCVAAPACWGMVARTLIAISTGGIGGSMEVFEFAEDSIPKELAEAYVKHVDASKATYGEESPLAKVYAIRLRPGETELLALIRFPNERDVDTFSKGETFEAAKVFAMATCIHGDLSVLEATAPFYYMAIARWLLHKAGAKEIELVGE